jgi:ribonuclease T2
MIRSRPSLAAAVLAALALIVIYAMQSANRPEPGAPGPSVGSHDTAGTFDYYVLVLGWAPTYCLSKGDLRNDAECDERTPHAFTLHGLWPQYQKGWPENCPTATKIWVPSEVIAKMRDIMPSKNLVIHEYRTHGTCSGLDPERYFAVSRQLYERIAVPPEFKATDAALQLSASEIERDFLAANLWLKPEMISITCRKGKLLDVRVCFGRDLAPRNCGANEDQGRLCSAGAIAVPPVAR